MVTYMVLSQLPNSRTSMSHIRFVATYMVLKYTGR
jgi:hypothetical protein